MSTSLLHLLHLSPRHVDGGFKETGISPSFLASLHLQASTNLPWIDCSSLLYSSTRTLFLLATCWPKCILLPSAPGCACDPRDPSRYLGTNNYPCRSRTRSWTPKPAESCPASRNTLGSQSNRHNAVAQAEAQRSVWLLTSSQPSQ